MMHFDVAPMTVGITECTTEGMLYIGTHDGMYNIAEQCVCANDLLNYHLKCSKLCTL